MKNIQSKKNISKKNSHGFTPLERNTFLRQLRIFSFKQKWNFKRRQKFITKRNQFSYPNFLTGFTLVEMIVVVGIFALVTGLILGNFREGKKNDDLRRGTLELEDNLRKVQVLGMSGQIVSVCVEGEDEGKSCEADDDCDGGTCESRVPTGGFGINIGQVRENGIECWEELSTINCPTTYDLFVDNSGKPGIYDVDDFTLAGGADYALPEGVSIRNFGWNCLWQSPDKPPGCPAQEDYGIDITFRPPKPYPYFYARPATIPDTAKAYAEMTVKILVQHESTNKCRELTINGVSGKISSEAIGDCPDDWQPWTP